MLGDSPFTVLELPAVTLSPRRAFSCFVWIDRKCDRRSCHLILSSLANLDRMADGCGWDALELGVTRQGPEMLQWATYPSLAGVWRKPSELTAPRRFRSEIKALDCGSNMRRP